MPPVAWIGLSRPRRTSPSSALRVEGFEVLAHRLAGDGEGVAVHQAGVEQRLHHDRDAADLVHVVHDVLPEGLEVAEVRDLVADAVEVVEVEVDVGLTGDGQEVEYGVGRAAEGHHDGDGVLEGGLGHDLAGGDALAQHLDDGLTGAVGEAVTAAVHGRRGCGAGQGHAQGLGDGRHRVGGVHAAAGALTGADRALDAVDLLAGDLAGEAGADRFEGVDDRDVLAIDRAGHGRAGIEEDRREVEASGCHQHAGQRLVAAREQDTAVESLGHHHGLDRVGDDLPGDEREVHALVAHRDAVGDRDRPELEGIATGRVHAVLHGLRQSLERQVAGRDLVPARGDTDLRLDPVVVAHAHCPEHAAGGRLLETVGDVAGTGLDVGLLAHDFRLVGTTARDSPRLSPTDAASRRAGEGAELLGPAVAGLPGVGKGPLRKRDAVETRRLPPLLRLRDQLGPGRMVHQVGQRGPAKRPPPPAVANLGSSRSADRARIGVNHAVTSAPSGAHHPSAHTNVCAG